MTTVTDLSPTIVNDFTTNGFVRIPAVFSNDDCTSMIAALNRSMTTNANDIGTRSIQRKNQTYALRGVLATVPELQSSAFLSPLRDLATGLLGRPAFVVRSLLFDKSSAANWNIRWHQDCTIAVKEKHDVSGFGPWSVKAGVPHVRPSGEVLNSMVALRVHLDDCDATNGALRVLPTGHDAGILTADEIANLREHVTGHTCTCAVGDVLAMRPLLPHASSAATTPNHRRVIHLEFSCAPLPAPLEWYENR